MARKTGLRAVALASVKGGVGKTTLSSVLAVRAAEDRGKVALIDCDPQASLARWWELRGEPDNPLIYDMDPSAEGLGLLMSEGWDWLFIDTPPSMMDRIEESILAADFVLIPCRASAIDLEAVTDVVDVCKRHRKPFAFVLNAAHPQWGRMNETAAEYLRHYGPVLPHTVGYRKAYVSAMTVGKSGPEIERDGQARKEIDAIWSSLKRAIAKARR